MVGKLIKYLLVGYTDKQDNPQYNIAQYLSDKPQNTPLPAATYTIEKKRPYKVKGHRGIANSADITINILSNSYSELTQITYLISSHLQHYKNAFNSNDLIDLGYGTPSEEPAVYTSDYLGMYSPPSTGAINYVAGMQIITIYISNVVESYDEDLLQYSNTINLTIDFADDPALWGSDFFITTNDLNLMAYKPGSGVLKYQQPALIDGDVDAIYTAGITTLNNPNINNGSYTIDNQYESFISQYPDDAPVVKAGAINYLNFGTNAYLIAGNESGLGRLNRKYKEITFFCLFDMPESNGSADKGAAIVHDANGGGFYAYTTQNSGGAAAGGITTFKRGVRALDTAGDSFGANVGDIVVSWPAFGMFTNYNWNEPVYMAFSMKRKESDGDFITGEFNEIIPAYIDYYFDRFDDYQDNAPAAGEIVADYMWNFRQIHATDTAFDTQGFGTIDINSELNLYNIIVWPECLVFGSAKYNEIRRYLINKVGLTK